MCVFLILIHTILKSTMGNVNQVHGHAVICNDLLIALNCSDDDHPACCTPSKSKSLKVQISPLFRFRMLKLKDMIRNVIFIVKVKMTGCNLWCVRLMLSVKLGLPGQLLLLPRIVVRVSVLCSKCISEQNKTIYIQYISAILKYSVSPIKCCKVLKNICCFC